MRRAAARVISGTIALSVLVLAGCSSNSATSQITNVTFKSGAVVRDTLPALYTCDGKNISPPLEWGAVPSATRELAVFLLGLKLNPATSKYSVSIEWGIAGVNPALHKLSAGELPAGAHVGLGTDGKKRYSVCPAKGTNKRYQFTLYAVPASVQISPRFADVRVLNALASPQSQTHAYAGGAFIANYKRR